MSIITFIDSESEIPFDQMWLTGIYYLICPRKCCQDYFLWSGAGVSFWDSCVLWVRYDIWCVFDSNLKVDKKLGSVWSSQIGNCFIWINPSLVTGSRGLNLSRELFFSMISFLSISATLQSFFTVKCSFKITCSWLDISRSIWHFSHWIPHWA